MNKPQVEKKSKIFEYDILRVVVTLLVVIGHSSYYAIISDYGGIDYSDLADSRGIIYKSYQLLVFIIYSFHMPLFMALSGALLNNSFAAPKYHDFKYFAKSKFLRLIIPFITVTFAYSVPLKYAAGFFSESDNIIKDVIIGQGLIQGNTHLWYILSLFGIFILMFVSENYFKVNSAVKFGILFIMFILGEYMPIKFFSYIMIYSMWFYIGYLFENVREKYNSKINLINTIVSLCIFAALVSANRKFNIDTMLENVLFSKLVNFIISISGMLATYNFCVCLTKFKIEDNKIFKLISKNSFGVYLYSDSLNYIIIACAVSVFGEELFTNNLYSFGFISFRLIITTVVSILITQVLRKFKLKYLV